MDATADKLDELRAQLDAEREAVMWLRSEVRALRRMAPARPSPWGLAAVAAFAGALIGVWQALS